ncbi:MAG: ATP-binding cassette domain-containing protein [Synechococcales cyanobacterium RU_4_20]|nr:ATP-binding cassette domain-containing protein [Synechococcales cyanobacterium RU_4_20]NJR70458.1 ATP-binding cassette domain-containing protein [Synechococcales cyanobacterium CRU_2_2]
MDGVNPGVSGLMVQVNPLDSSAPIELLLQLDQVTLQTRRGDVSLLQHISCSLGAGEWVLLVGDAGSGKTLLFRLLTGLLSPTQGKILLQGQPLAQWPGPELRRRVAWVPRLPRLLGMSVKEAIATPSSFKPCPT